MVTLFRTDHAAFVKMAEKDAANFPLLTPEILADRVRSVSAHAAVARYLPPPHFVANIVHNNYADASKLNTDSVTVFYSI